jgi:phosphoribosylformimino-5-aminoimidazole carboxamide ribotide isomerase
MEVIPAIDLRAGQVVRLEQGDYARETVYDTDPARAATRLVSAGASRIHVVDLDGAREGELCNQPVIEQLLDAVGSVPIQVGGGIRSMARIEAVLGLGVQRVILGTAAIESPDLVRDASDRFPERIVLGLDAKDGRVAIRGWLGSSGASAEELLERLGDLPLGAILHTDVGRDGMMRGPNIDATAQLARMTRIPVLASGGVRSLEDLRALARTGVIAGAVVGRALYTGAIDLSQALREVERC